MIVLHQHLPNAYKKKRVIAALFLSYVGLTGCSGAGTADVASTSGPVSQSMTAQQKQLVAKGVKQIIKDDGVARLISMNGAPAKTARQTNVCGYVGYKTPDGKSVEQRYFVRLGQENGIEATLMGQVANNPANAAKVKFMCTQAGLG